jgi:hypothetical protein
MGQELSGSSKAHYREHWVFRGEPSQIHADPVFGPYAMIQHGIYSKAGSPWRNRYRCVPARVIQRGDLLRGPYRLISVASVATISYLASACPSLRKGISERAFAGASDSIPIAAPRLPQTRAAPFKWPHVTSLIGAPRRSAGHRVGLCEGYSGGAHCRGTVRGSGPFPSPAAFPLRQKMGRMRRTRTTSGPSLLQNS